MVSSEGSTGEGLASNSVVIGRFSSSMVVGLWASVHCWPLAGVGPQLLSVWASPSCFIRANSWEEKPGRKRERSSKMEVTVHCSYTTEVTLVTFTIFCWLEAISRSKPYSGWGDYTKSWSAEGKDQGTHSEAANPKPQMYLLTELKSQLCFRQKWAR